MLLIEAWRMMFLWTLKKIEERKAENSEQSRSIKKGVLLIWTIKPEIKEWKLMYLLWTREYPKKVRSNN